MLDVQRSISGALLPVMPPAWHLCNPPTQTVVIETARPGGGNRAGWRGSEEEGRWDGGTAVELQAHCWGPAAAQSEAG